MQILFKVCLQLPELEQEAVQSPPVIQRPSLFIFGVLICPVASGQSSDVMLLTPKGVNS